VTSRVTLISPALGPSMRQARFDDGTTSLDDGAQARTAGMLRPAVRVVTSPSVRCQETAEALGLDAGESPTELAGLRVGRWQGLTLDEVSRACDVLNLLTPRRIDLLEVGHAAFVVFTTPEGTIDTEGVVVRDGEESFQVSVGGDTRPPTWLHDAIDKYPGTRAEEADLSSFNIKGRGGWRRWRGSSPTSSRVVWPGSHAFAGYASALGAPKPGSFAP
jgi:hypothetical protein